MDTQDKKDEVKQNPVETQEEIKKVADAAKDASYIAQPKDAK